MTVHLISIDIGGTHARFADARIDAAGGITVGPATTLQTRDHATFRAAWDHYVAARTGPAIVAVAMAVAGPADGGVIRFTNNPWVIDPAEIAAGLGVGSHVLLNDFEAIGHAVACAGSDDFVTLAGPDTALPARGTISVVGPGTGLGVAHVWRDGGGGYRVQPTEGGHIDFAPLDVVEDAMLARLRLQHGRVSAERVVSGPGLMEIWRTLAALESRPVAAVEDRALWALAAAGTDPLAAAAADRFCLALGSFAGDIALAHGAAGVVIAGGLGQRIRDRLVASDFARRFTAKGRFADRMASIPVKLITHPEPGLFGAAAAYARHRELI